MMELHGQQDWPESGVTFLKEMLKIIRQNVLPCKISYENIIQSEYGKESPIGEILSFIKILSEITIIKKNHGVLVTIAEYTQVIIKIMEWIWMCWNFWRKNRIFSKDNDQEIIFTILDKIPLEELQRFVNGFLSQLILEKNLNADVIISEYIQVSVLSRSTAVICQFKINFELRVFCFSASLKDQWTGGIGKKPHGKDE